MKITLNQSLKELILALLNLNLLLPICTPTYGGECESNVTNNKKVMVLGSGPNRIGQGIEFDYCCVHASLAMQEEGIESIMVNCNPETVSTDLMFQIDFILNQLPLKKLWISLMVNLLV